MEWKDITDKEFQQFQVNMTRAANQKSPGPDKLLDQAVQEPP